MKIFDSEPIDWQALQEMVAQMFLEMGCRVEIGGQVELVRGKKEIDVHIWDSEAVPKAEYLCECKFWRNAIPQEVVHSFRTVVADYGAHRGFVVSRAGFQRGAREAVQNTNIDLLTFEELQRTFFDRWRVAWAKRFMPYADRLFPYWDPSGGKRPGPDWGDWHRQKLRELNEVFLPLLHLGPTLELQGFHWNLPMILPAMDARGEVVGEVTLSTYRELYDFIDKNKDTALRLYRELFGEIDEG